MRRSALALVALAALGCADKTGLLVEVTSDDLSVPSDVDALRFVVESNAGHTIDRTFELQSTWPHSLTILPAGGMDDAVTITVIGLRAGEARVRRVVPASFVRGETRRVVITLSRDCLDRACPEGVDCVGGMCVGGTTMDGGVDAGVDAGVEPDGGRDAGRRDAGGRDAGTGDDAGMDAGAGTDAGEGTDAGPVPIRCASDPPLCRGLLVISELSAAGASAGDEFVEIHNRSGAMVDASQVEVRYAATTSSSPATRATIPEGVIIPPGGFYLAASVDYTGATTPDLPAAWSGSQGFSADRGAILLVSGVTVLDLVGWRRSGETDVPMSEGAPIPYGSTSFFDSGSFERKASATSTDTSMGPGGAEEGSGNGFDGDDNATDFVLRSSRQPQSSADPPEPG